MMIFYENRNRPRKTTECVIVTILKKLLSIIYRGENFYQLKINILDSYRYENSFLFHSLAFSQDIESLFIFCGKFINSMKKTSNFF